MYDSMLGDIPNMLISPVNIFINKLKSISPVNNFISILLSSVLYDYIDTMFDTSS